METLSIIAYRQPVTRAEIEKIRGVSSAYAVNKLIEYGLVYEAGRLDVPGRPAAFATTEEFLRRFGVASRKELPSLDADTEAQIIRDVTKEVGYRPEDEAQESIPETAGEERGEDPEEESRSPQEELQRPKEESQDIREIQI